MAAMIAVMPMAGTTPLREEEKAAIPTGRLSTPEPTIALTRLMVDDDSEALPAVESSAAAMMNVGDERGFAGRLICRKS